MFGKYGFAENWKSRTSKIQRKIVYIMFVWNVGICRKNEYPEQRKFKVKLCTLYMYGTSGFAEKLNFQNYENSTGNCVHYMCTKKSGFAKNLNIQNCENSMGNYVHYICTECRHLQKIWIFRTVKIHLEIVYTINVQNVRICKEIEFLEQSNLNGKLCTFYVRNVWICRKLNIQNCENSTRNCVHFISTECLDLLKIEDPKRRKFIRKLCTLYMYRMSRFPKKLNIQSCENSTENCVRYICTECLD